MKDRVQIIKYHDFFKEKYGKDVFGRSRKREIVMKRKLIIWFLVKEKSFKNCYVAKIMRVDHSTVFHYMKPVFDLEFDRFYIPRVRELKKDFETAFPDNTN